VITTEIGGEKEVMDSLSTIPEVKEIHEVYGIYDIIVRVETSTMPDLKDTVGQKVRSLDKVRSTMTMLFT
jgi:DNA-binding Lrp family transcriptional regulator